MKKRIKIIFTGGTIGSAAKDGKIDLYGGAKRLLLQLYAAERGNDITFDCEEPVCMLSENVHEEQLDAIYAAIKATNTDDYDGIVVTNGTDSLCINAHYFGMTLCDMGLPGFYRAGQRQGRIRFVCKRRRARADPPCKQTYVLRPTYGLLPQCAGGLSRARTAGRNNIQHPPFSAHARTAVLRRTKRGCPCNMPRRYVYNRALAFKFFAV